MTCHFTEPERIAGEGTGQLIVRVEATPDKPCECGPLRMLAKIISIVPVLDIAVVEFKINDDFTDYGTIFMETSNPAEFDWLCGCGDPEILFEWRLHLPDQADTYEVGDLWHWEQEME